MVEKIFIGGALILAGVIMAVLVVIGFVLLMISGSGKHHAETAD